MTSHVKVKPGERLVSLDAYRGFVMLAMASAGLAIPKVATHFPDSQLWSMLEHQVEHVSWTGCAFWDLIQPSFMFIVGVAMPFSYAQRREQGQTWGQLFRHAVWRSIVLIALGVFLASAWSAQTNFVFTNVLAQIGLGYTVVFLVLGRRPSTQAAVALVILVGYWLAFALWPLPARDFNYAAVGVPAHVVKLQGFAAHWGMNTNPAAAFDRWFLNLFPRPDGKPFHANEGGYATLNFVPSIATMIFGVLAGEFLRTRNAVSAKVRTLFLTGACCIVLGSALDGSIFPVVICPIVKRIWTPSWTIFSTGWTLILLAIFYGLIDGAGYRRWAFPFVVVGLNSITIYMMAQLMKPFVANMLKIHAGPLWKAVAHCERIDRWVFQEYGMHLDPQLFGGLYGPMVQSASVLFVFWLICYWLYRQRIFVKI